eukprot:11318950-Ditylum_brightwellii.AAC.1
MDNRQTYIGLTPIYTYPTTAPKQTPSPYHNSERELDTTFEHIELVWYINEKHHPSSLPIVMWKKKTSRRRLLLSIVCI